MENKRIPFDWEKYQSGEFEAVCRDGVKPDYLAYNPNAKAEQRIAMWRNGELFSTRENGLTFNSTESTHDLFLIPKPKKFQAWVNLYSNGISSTHSNKQLADELASDVLKENPSQGFELIECRLIEWEG